MINAINFAQRYTNMKHTFGGCFFLLLFIAAGGQKKADKKIIGDLQQYVQYLAGDALQGRRTGSAGEKMAYQYIQNEFSKNKLLPRGEDGYLQPFTVNDGKGWSAGTYLSVNGQSLEAKEDFIPLPYSANGRLQGKPLLGIQEPNMPWFIDLKDIRDAEKENFPLDLAADVYEKAKRAAKKSATAVVFYNTDPALPDLVFDAKDQRTALDIPVVYLKKNALEKILKDAGNPIDLEGNVLMEHQFRTGHNVIGYIDNGAAYTVIIGAHYDHLGYGEDGNSLYHGAKAIHNGADDNASGVAALLALAPLLKTSRLRHNNYLFIAFSGEELGLHGSRYFTEHPTIDLGRVNYMINLDMVGRLNATHVLWVGGVGTSPAWGKLLNETKFGDLKFKFDSTGAGPSDHRSFYQKNLPVLFLFTGIHSDYHRPSDDADKINYEGELAVVKWVYHLIAAADKEGKLAFTKTREPSMTASRFSVTLGIMPDYGFDGEGVKIEGIADERPAQKAGMQAGDVILQLGAYQTSSLESYMQALSRFKKGDKTIAKIKRGQQELFLAIEF